MLHKNIIVGDNHILHNWEVADEAELLALEVTAADRGKVAWQLDIGILYFLANHEPILWKPLGAEPPEEEEPPPEPEPVFKRPSIHGAFAGPVPAAPMYGVVRYYPREGGTLWSAFAALSEPAEEEVVAELCLNGAAEWAIIIPTGEETSTTEIEMILVPGDYITVNLIRGKGNNLSLRFDY